MRREVKLTDTEDAALGFAAAELNITVPRYLKESGLAASRGETATERAALLKQLFLVQRELSAIGNNLNQIARGVNIDGHVQADVHEVLDALRSSLRHIDVSLDELSLDGVSV